MANSNDFKPGDKSNDILRKILNRLKNGSTTPDVNDFRPGDKSTEIKRKILARLKTLGYHD